MEIGVFTLNEWASRRYELVYNESGLGNYSAWDIISMLDSNQIDLDMQIRAIGFGTVKLGDSAVYKNADKLRMLTGASMQVMLLDSLEKLRIRFLWFSIGVGLILLGFFLAGIRVYVAQ
jgi:hypothetical protein